MKARMRVKVSSTGTNAVRARLLDLPAEIDRFCEAVMDDALTEFRQRVHVITGLMRDSARVYRIGPGRYLLIDEVEYGIYEEFGTRYRPGHPAFYPAVLAAVRRANSAADQHIGRGAA